MRAMIDGVRTGEIRGTPCVLDVFDELFPADKGRFVTSIHSSAAAGGAGKDKSVSVSDFRRLPILLKDHV